MAAQLAPGSCCVAANLQGREPAAGSSSAGRGFCCFRTLRGLQFSGTLKNFSKDAVRPVLVAAARGRGGAKPARIDGKIRGGTKPAHIAGKNRREMDENDAAEAALEALFLQLEKDLESEGEDDDDDGDITQEEMVAFEEQLEAALMGLELDDDDDEGDEEEEADDEISADGEPGLVDMVMTDGVYGQAANGSHKQEVEGEEEEDEEEDEDEDEEEEEDQRTVPLEKWQIRRLAAAVDQGRRHVNVKSLAAELGMDRADVLFFLKDPPPELLLMSASFEEPVNNDVPSRKPPKVVTSERNIVSKPATTDGGPPGPKSWHNNKRLRKEHVATFERVYRQTHRPSNAMIENLVVLTHVPRKKIVQWFDDRRLQNESKKSSFDAAPEL